jgi:hypothetical protein
MEAFVREDWADIPVKVYWALCGESGQAGANQQGSQDAGAVMGPSHVRSLQYGLSIQADSGITQ